MTPSGIELSHFRLVAQCCTTQYKLFRRVVSLSQGYQPHNRLLMSFVTKSELAIDYSTMHNILHAFGTDVDDGREQMDGVRRGSEVGTSTESMQERAVSVVANNVVRSTASSPVKKNKIFSVAYRTTRRPGPSAKI
jgi:hypothetical protein